MRLLLSAFALLLGTLTMTAQAQKLPPLPKTISKEARQQIEMMNAAPSTPAIPLLFLETPMSFDAPSRRSLLQGAAALAAAALSPLQAAVPERRFEPRPGPWRRPNRCR